VLAIVFVALVSMDYGKVKQWTQAALVHEIAIKGLPINSTDLDEHSPGTKVAEEIGPQTLDQIYSANPGAAAGGGQFAGLPKVKTVEEELDQVRSKAESTIKSATPADQYKLFYMFLVSQARTLGERLQLEKTIDELRKLDTELIPQAPNDQKLQLDRQQHFDAL